MDATAPVLPPVPCAAASEARATTPTSKTTRSQKGKFSETMLVTPERRLIAATTNCVSFSFEREYTFPVILHVWAKPGAVHDTAINTTATMRTQLNQYVFTGEPSIATRRMMMIYHPTRTRQAECGALF
jgi:hypothetical protein